MNEIPTAPDSPPPHRLALLLRKLILSVAALFIVWLIFAQIMPRMLFQRQSNDVAPVERRQNAIDVLKEKEEHLTTLAARLEQTEAKLKAIEESPPLPAASDKPFSPPPQNNETIDDDRIPRLEAKIEEMEQALNAVGDQLTSLRAIGDRRLAAITVFGQLKETVLRGEPYTELLAQMKAWMEDNVHAQELLAQLTPDAEKGIITQDELSGVFKAIIPQALTSNDEGWIAKLRRVIRIRKIGDQQGSDDESIIARAEARLEGGNIEAALSELSQLSAPAATAFAAWVNQAQHYQQLRAALSGLQLALIDNGAEPAAKPHP